ncbi:MAG: ATP-binding protein [Muribaculaceae bacterium]|nr:ATP-binding protein [Muribaculaceae bacterium]
MKKFDIQNQVVIMCGISGAGKTQYALRLVEEGFFRLSTDVMIWEKVGDKLFSLSKEEQKRLFAECREEVFKQLKSLLKSGTKVVVDATHCKRMVRDEIRKIYNETDIKPVFVYCYAEKEELLRRLSQRKGEGPDDLIVTEEELLNYWLGFERPQEDESDIIFCKTD